MYVYVHQTLGQATMIPVMNCLMMEPRYQTTLLLLDEVNAAISWVSISNKCTVSFCDVELQFCCVLSSFFLMCACMALRESLSFMPFPIHVVDFTFKT